MQEIIKNYHEFSLNEYYLLYEDGLNQELMNFCIQYFNDNKDNYPFEYQYPQIILLILIKHDKISSHDLSSENIKIFLNALLDNPERSQHPMEFVKDAAIRLMDGNREVAKEIIEKIESSKADEKLKAIFLSKISTINEIKNIEPSIKEAVYNQYWISFNARLTREKSPYKIALLDNHELLDKPISHSILDFKLLKKFSQDKELLQLSLNDPDLFAKCLQSFSDNVSKLMPDKKEELLFDPRAWRRFINWIKAKILQMEPQSTESFAKKIEAEESSKSINKI